MIALIFDTVVWALALALCLPGAVRSPARAWLAPLVIAGLLSIPLGPSSAIGALRGAFASPSVLSLILIVALAAQRAGWSVLRQGEALLIGGLAGIVGLLFYPPALGLGPVDPYAWGYGGPFLPLAAGLTALLAASTGRWVLAIGLGAALAGWRSGLLDSTNLWDYLLDPVLALGGLVGLLAGRLRANSRKRAGLNPAAARSVTKPSDAR